MNTRIKRIGSLMLLAAACGDVNSLPAPTDNFAALPEDGSDFTTVVDPVTGEVIDPLPEFVAPEDAVTPPVPENWFECQISDEAFVRKAIIGVLGRRPYSQAEVNLYTDLIKAVDVEDKANETTRDNAPGADLSHSRKVMLNALFRTPEYQVVWADRYRDFLRVQRVEEQFNRDCFELPGAGSAVAAAKFVRDRSALDTPTDASNLTMHDVIAGSIALDDVTPIYTANVFAMMALTYAGANAEPVALELSRRADFGAWFDEVYLHRDTVCLNCHNSEFSVTQTDDPATNRHFPIPALLEKAMFQSSTGPATFGGFEGGDRAHAPLRYKQLVFDCSTRTYTQEQAAKNKWAKPAKPCLRAEELVHRCDGSEVVCEHEYQTRIRNSGRPWNWNEACGLFTRPEYVKSDMAGVEAQFGSVTGLRTSEWDVAASLRSGFDKLVYEGLGASPEWEVSDPDKAFAYLVAMNVAEKVWLQIVGTPLTIPTRFPRNAASRDQLQYLTETFIASGFSNQALIEAVFASPYVNIAPPSAGCGEAYALPNVFDPWIIAEDDPVKRKNSAADGVISFPSRTATGALYAALEWTPIVESLFPDIGIYDEDDPKTPENEEDPMLAVVAAERQFQGEVGFFLKNSEPGFRGFDFQARLGWENRFGQCNKNAGVAGGPDFIDKLAGFAGAPDRGSVRDLIVALKDRLIGDPSIDELKERPALEALLGVSLDADGNSLADAAVSLRKVCGVLVSSPQFLLSGLVPNARASVPKFTPLSAGYPALCTKLAAAMPPAYRISCNGESLLLNAPLSAAEGSAP